MPVRILAESNYNSEVGLGTDEEAKPDKELKPPVPEDKLDVSPQPAPNALPKEPSVQPSVPPAQSFPPLIPQPNIRDAAEDLGEDDEDDPLFDLLVAFVEINPDPTEAQLDLLAGALGIDTEEVTEGLLSLMQAMLEDPELNEQMRAEIRENLNS